MRTGHSFGPHAVPLTAVRCGSPVLDARGALLGKVEYVETGQPDGRSRTCSGLHFVKVSGYGPGDREFIVAADLVAYVADDHVRLSVAADDPTLSTHPL